MNYPLIKPTFYYSLLIEISGFIRTPSIAHESQKTFLQKIYDIFGLYVLKFLFLIPLLLFFALIYDPPNVQGVSMAKRFSPAGLLLVGGLILPLIEEVGFRLSLKFRPIYLALSMMVLFYYFLTKAIFHTKNSAIDESFTTRAGLSILLGVVVFPILSSSAVRTKLAQFWKNHFRSIFYFSCILFAWIHISKYEVNLTNVLLLPILTLPQLMSAIIFGYTRVRFGFRYPLFFHMCMNLLPISLSFFLSSD